MNAERYSQILIYHVLQSGTHLIGNGLICHLENDPNHTHNAIKAYVIRKTHNGTLSIMDWPPQSLEVDNTEAMWGHIDGEWKKRKPKSKERAMNVLQ